MIHEEPSSAVIHFYQKMIDKTVLIRFTTDFIMRIFGLFYKKKHKSNDGDSDRIIQSIQATLFAKINEYAKDIKVDEDNIIEIMFDKNDLIPVVQHYNGDKRSDVLLNVFFKKIGWDEINVFRFFFVRYMEYYFKKINIGESGKKTVSDLSYIVQELLQNANAYSTGEFDYELKVKHKNGFIYISVENYTDETNLAMLTKIINDINNTKDLQDLILKYMLSQDKHLGLISSVFNNNIEKINYSVSEDNRVRVDVIVKI
ncbi:MAG: hypothetical protein A2015_00510 [Spirochaetes bacterium GWF1_31_7]|nr:MAG: hypothetical protein A2Y30_04000 [Spirochaetes bacterium GWE1_32_154]OHD45155.1 MAG: hypothetical protein A2Y29_15895 [Spirochaetes bacterium GWE2_31_10]OHD51064.1 MAG: hypothetical protein A2015_00510 [Spirochaetes bacterium GWF1_31_7]HBD94388.1 hypothetical protein [Spirochaetia bacterium]HBI37859.1 hypothetical protein [Spirochaetia bacterium]